MRSPSLSSDEQSSEASLLTVDVGAPGAPGGTPLSADTPDNLMQMDGSLFASFVRDKDK